MKKTGFLLFISIVFLFCACDNNRKAVNTADFESDVLSGNEKSEYTEEELAAEIELENRVYIKFGDMLIDPNDPKAMARLEKLKTPEGEQQFEEIERQKRKSSSGGISTKSFAYDDFFYGEKWDNGDVNYKLSRRFKVFDGTTCLGYDPECDELREKIKMAMDYLKQNCGVRFRRRSPTFDSYVTIYPTENTNYSTIGETFRGKIHLSKDASFGTIVHELMHTMCYLHEHQRYDRNNYVKIFKENVKSGKYTDNFKKIDKYDRYDLILFTLEDQISRTFTDYDYDSIMHYSEYAFNKNGKKTIESYGHPVGQRNCVSYRDRIGLIKVYGAPSNSRAVLQTDRGFIYSRNSRYPFEIDDSDGTVNLAHSRDLASVQIVQDVFADGLAETKPVTTTFFLKNTGKKNLELDPVEPVKIVSVSGSEDGSFEIIEQPSLTSIPKGGTVTFKIRFFTTSFTETRAVISFNTNDPLNKDFEFEAIGTGIHGKYIGRPYYYNRLDYLSDILEPGIGEQFLPSWTYKNWPASISGPAFASSYATMPYKFYNGIQVYFNRGDKKYSEASLYLFNEDKPDMSRGTLAFWGNAAGSWRGKGRNTHADAKLVFYFTPDLYFYAHGIDKHDNCNVKLVYNKKEVYSTLLNGKHTIRNYAFQWDLGSGFGDGSNLKFYIDGVLVKSVAVSLTADDFYNADQRFYLKAWCSRNGSKAPKGRGAYAAIDNILMWNTIERPIEIYLIPEENI